MTKNYYTTETFDKQHIHFGGRIYPSDFNTECRGDNRKIGESSSIATRIESDFNWEKKLLKKGTIK